MFSFWLWKLYKLIVGVLDYVILCKEKFKKMLVCYQKYIKTDDR